MVGIDNDPPLVAKAKRLSPVLGTSIDWLVADIEHSLPFAPACFDLVLVVHYVSDTVLGKAREVLRPGGYLVFETFDARGENWRALPRVKSTAKALMTGFDTLVIRERAVGPDASREVVRVLACRTRDG